MKNNVTNYFVCLGAATVLLSACNKEQMETLAKDSNDSQSTEQLQEFVTQNSQGTLQSFTKRVNIQAEYALPAKIIDQEWVAVGIATPHALQIDGTLPYAGQHSFRFELREEDNSLSGYNEGETKGRSELSFCYATPEDFANLPKETYQNAQILKTVYHYGKGSCPQGSSWHYRFAIRVPDTLNPDVNTIFAQWHGMPRRNVAQNPQGEVVELTDEEFIELEKTTIFTKEVGYEKIPVTDAQGNVTYKKGKENGWLIEQGGYPPLAFGFNSGFFYIKANSDRKWFSDKNDRTNASIKKLKNMQSVSSEYKTSTIAYKSPLADFPRNTWVEFDVTIDWTAYGAEKETIEKDGHLDVTMKANGEEYHLVNNEVIPIGRNDRDGYYFKFGIYRTSSSTVPVIYNLAGFHQEPAGPACI